MKPERAQTVLKWLLLIGGGLAATAIFAVVMPTDWMEATNDRLGLGPFHRSPLTEYLTRSLSAFYAFHGFMSIYLSRQVARYADFLVFYGWLSVGFGAVLTAIDFLAGMPSSWSWGEGPGLIALALVIVWLARNARER